MLDGKKTIAENILKDSFAIIKQKTHEEPLKLFHRAVNYIKPSIELKAIRIAGTTYKVPKPITKARQQTLALKWLIESARNRNEKSMKEKLAFELIDASKEQGISIKKRDEIHKLAEANKVFSDFRY
jgi:small subunit ribosomal protein S7